MSLLDIGVTKEYGNGKVVAVFGSGQPKPGDSRYEMVRDLGRELANRGYAVATGAYGGIMAAAVQGAKDAGGLTIGFTHSGKQANEFIDEVIDCKQLGKNVPFFSDYGIRLSGLLSCDHFVFVAGGGIGTFLELIAVMNFQQKFWDNSLKHEKTSVILSDSASRKDEKGWDHRMLDMLHEWRFCGDPETGDCSVVICDDPEEAARWVHGSLHDSSF